MTAYRCVIVLVVVVLLAPMLFGACGKTIGETLDDPTITTRVKTALLNDPDIGVLRIDVDTTAGIVTLSGDVRSKDEAERAMRLARGVKGVKDVKSSLKIGGVPMPPHPPESADPARRAHAAIR